jgi:hypothetical protein
MSASAGHDSQPGSLVPLQFSLVQPPKYHYHLSLYGGDLTLLPGVEAWLDSVINDCVIQCVAIAALPFVYFLCTDHALCHL